MIHKPILITGVPRSGTSLTAGIIHLSRAWGGEMKSKFRNPRRGIFENTEIQLASKIYLKYKLGVDPKGQESLPNLFDLNIQNQLINSAWDWRGKIVSIVRRQGYDYNLWKMPWFYKSSRVCLLWPMWYDAFPEAHWIIVKRNPHDIAQSCMDTGYMTAHSTIEGWEKWVDSYNMIFDDIKRSKIMYNVIEPERVINGDFDQIKSVVKDLGLVWRENQVKSFIKPNLWKLEGSDGQNN